MQTVQVEVKIDKYESRVLVCFCCLIYYLQQVAAAVDYLVL